MARLTNSAPKSSQRKGKVSPISQPQEAKGGNKEFSFTFAAPAGHVSTGKTLVVFKGRGKGGVDMYIPLELIAKELGYLPEGAEITVSVKAQGKAVHNPEVAVPKTSQHLFDKGDSHTWEEVYGGTFAEHMRALKNAKPEEAKREPKAAQGKRGAKAEDKAEDKAESSNMEKRMIRLEQLVERFVSGK